MKNFFATSLLFFAVNLSAVLPAAFGESHQGECVEVLLQDGMRLWDYYECQFCGNYTLSDPSAGSDERRCDECDAHHGGEEFHTASQYVQRRGSDLYLVAPAVVVSKILADTEEEMKIAQADLWYCETCGSSVSMLDPDCDNCGQRLDEQNGKSVQVAGDREIEPILQPRQKGQDIDEVVDQARGYGREVSVNLARGYQVRRVATPTLREISKEKIQKVKGWSKGTYATGAGALVASVVGFSVWANSASRIPGKLFERNGEYEVVYENDGMVVEKAVQPLGTPDQVDDLIQLEFPIPAEGEVVEVHVTRGFGFTGLERLNGRVFISWSEN